MKGHLDDLGADPLRAAKNSEKLKKLVCAASQCESLHESRGEGLNVNEHHQVELFLRLPYIARVFKGTFDHVARLKAEVMKMRTQSLRKSLEKLQPIAQGTENQGSWKKDIKEDTSLKDIGKACLHLSKGPLGPKLSNGAKELDQERCVCKHDRKMKGRGSRGFVGTKSC